MSLNSIRILYVSEASFYGGAERYLIDVANGAAKAGAEVRIVFIGKEPEKSFLLRLEESELVHSTIPDLLSLNPLKLHQLWSVNASFRPEIVHINSAAWYSMRAGLATLILKFMTNAMIVTTEHMTRYPRVFPHSIIKRIAISFTSQTITISESNRNELVFCHKVPAHKTQTILNGIGDPLLEPSVREADEILSDKIIISVIGSLSERKGHLELIAALEGIESSKPYELLVVGDGPIRTELESRITRAGLQDRIRVLGFRDDVIDILGNTDIFVLPSRREGMPYVIVEAMAMGKPVIASNVDGIPEMVAHDQNGFLVKVGDVEGLRKAIVCLLDDPETRIRMGRRSREIFEKLFQIERCWEETFDVYRKSLEFK